MDDRNLFRGLSDTGLEPEGKGIELRISTANGKGLDVRIEAHDLTDLIHHLIELARESAKLRTKGRIAPPNLGQNQILSGIPATSLGLSLAADRALHLTVGFYDFELSFQIDASDLRSIGREFEQIAQTLEGPEG
jgi:hypothetical protein